MIVILTVVMFGCANDSKSENEKNTGPVETEQSEEQEQAVNQADSEEETVMPISDSQETEIQETKALNSSLEGAELLNSLSMSKPKSMKMVMEINTFGTKTISTVYYDGDNSRAETVVDGIGTNVVINNAAEKVVYNYVEGSGQGVKIIDADSELVEEAGLMMDMSTKLAAITDASSEDITARVETLDGEEVVYIEATEADEDMGDMLVKMWYSTKYSAPLKYEVITGEQPLMTLKMVEIESGIKVDPSMFEPASDIEFQEVSMDMMMDMME